MSQFRAEKCHSLELRNASLELRNVSSVLTGRVQVPIILDGELVDMDFGTYTIDRRRFESILDLNQFWNSGIVRRQTLPNNTQQ